jgi:DNA invertase Pin-like site-specific DNA recombinase
VTKTIEKTQGKTVKQLETLPKIARRKRVAAYARVSSAKDAMRHSLSAQISYYGAYIERHPAWEFVGVYADEAVTGTKDRREQFQRLLADCRAGKIDMVITKSVTRFARNTLTTLETLRELRALGVDVFFERENIHSMSGDGELMLTILASYAQEESRSVSENCKWRIRRMFKEGRPNTGHMLGYRLRGGKLCVIPEEAETVRLIFALYLSGMGKMAIARELGALGLRSTRGGIWSQHAIADILRNEKYMGDLTLQKTFSTDHLSKIKRQNRGELPMYHVKNSHEAIIERETFDAVQREIARRVKAHSKQAPSDTDLVFNLSPNNLNSALNSVTNPDSHSNPFIGRIRCMFCGKHFCRKHSAFGLKYDKMVWMCHTFNSLGRDYCKSRKIPENILMAKCAEVLGLPDFDADIFTKQITEIQVTAKDCLRFIFNDGHSEETVWQNPSRRNSWTEEMKQAAKERALHRHQKQRAEKKETDGKETKDQNERRKPK